MITDKYKTTNVDDIEVLQTKTFDNMKMFLTDCDGYLTDAGIYYSENGDEKNSTQEM